MRVFRPMIAMIPLAGCAVLAPQLKALDGTKVEARANVPPLTVSTCFPTNISPKCKVEVTPTVGGSAGNPNALCHVKYGDVKPGALVVERSLLEPSTLAIEWSLARLPDPSSIGQFGFVKSGLGKPYSGITFFDVGPNDYGASVETGPIGTDPPITVISIKPGATSKGKAHHYDIRLVFKAFNSTDWVECDVLDPVIINRG